PWLKFRRKQSTPDWISIASRSGASLAGPIVATILQSRARIISPLVSGDIQCVVGKGKGLGPRLLRQAQDDATLIAVAVQYRHPELVEGRRLSRPSYTARPFPARAGRL